MRKQKLSQDEIDKIVVAGRIVGEPTVYGVATNDIAFQNIIDRIQIWQYLLWRGMLRRCFCEKFKAESPTYQDVTCCDEWLSFATFLEWVNKEVGYSGKPQGYCLDKDLIVKDNKVYSPKACSFVPKAVNNLLTDSNAIRGRYPVGVNYHKKTGKFVVQLSVYGRQKHLGLFLKPEDAFAAYKIAKEAQVKVVALRHKDVLKPAVYEALMNWKVEP